MRRIGTLCVLVCLGATPAAGQSITVTLPTGGANPVASANDFATRVMQDPWDMNQRTDGGGVLNGVDFPPHGFSSFSFSGGIFSGTIAADPNLWLLETAWLGAAPVGRFGVNFPIDTNQYRIVAVRMRVSQPSYFMFWWSTNSMFDPPGLQGSNPVFTTPGWRIYFVDLAALGLAAGSEPWSGTKRSLRFDPAADNATGTVEIDWVRLVQPNPSLIRTISWNTTGPVDIYLDNDNSATSDPNQTLGLVASSVTGGSYSLNVGALAPGNYFVAVRASGTNNPFSYSTGFYQVNAPATLTVTSPSDEGSADDFATVQLNDAWDMTSASDVDHTLNIVSQGITSIAGAETEAGSPLGNVTAFAGLSTLGEFNQAPCTSFAKPAVYMMHASLLGATKRIDPNRYRILTAELGLPNKPRDICGGSIVRIVWQVAGAPFETYSDDIILNSRAGANVVSRLNLDMATLPIEPGSPSHVGWVPGSSPNPGISGFRIDPHEFANPTAFFISRVKLAALERADSTYTVRWTSSRTGGTVRVYYDTDKDPSAKTLIGSTSASSLSGSLVWNTAGLPHGAEYFVYVEFDDGLNVNGTYSKWPIRIDHSAALTARLVPNRSTLNFGVTALTVKTPPQTVRVTVLDAPAGQPCWTATSDLAILQISPGSGCGNGSFTVSLVNQNYPGVVDYFGLIRIASPAALNSPQVIQTAVRVRNNGTAPPFGNVDTPANGVAVSGSVAFTGWAADDIGVTRVTVCRDPVAPEPSTFHPACAGNQVYIGDAVFVEDARPDIEVFSPTTPLNYRAGYGFLVLTNMLPNQGTGTFVLHMHAFDIEGHRTLLGSRVIVGQNSTATEPFGAIDTPAQGETIGGSGYANFGWVLSRVNRADPPGGGSVIVYIDGVAVGTPCCWNQRSDLNALFPGYPGLSTALGVFGFDPLAYGNGLHTIVWGVTDNRGVSSGIGSRFFSIFNTGSAMTLAGGAMRPAGPDLGKRLDQIGGIRADVTVATRVGFSLRRPLEPAPPGMDGVPRVRATERERVEIRVAAAARTNDEYGGYLVVDGRLRELPVGSSFDPATGSFFWHPGLGYIGDYDLLIVRTGPDGGRLRIPVRVTLQPRPAWLASAAPWMRLDFTGGALEGVHDDRGHGPSTSPTRGGTESIR